MPGSLLDPNAPSNLEVGFLPDRAATAIEIGRFFTVTRMNPAARNPAAVACSATFATPTCAATPIGLITGIPGGIAIGNGGGTGGGGGGAETGGGPIVVVSTTTVATGNDCVTAVWFVTGRYVALVYTPWFAWLPTILHANVMHASTGTFEYGGPSATTLNDTDHVSPMYSAFRDAFELQFHP